MTVAVMTTNVCAAVMEMSGLRSMSSLLPEADRAPGWDGLSKYDLTKLNPWYISRIKELAEKGAKNGFAGYQPALFPA